MLVGSFRQQPGRTTFDTKHDLTEDPAGFLARALHLWNPDASFGELQNQAYGYLFPQGIWFVLTDALGMPGWVSQRLWSALLLIVAFEGTRLLARVLGLPRGAALVAGLAYALAPRMVGSSGVLTGELLPSTLLAWMLLPLVLTARGRLSPRAGGLLSGVAVLGMSGVNAVGTLAMLPAGAILVLAYLRRPFGRRLAAWWAVGVAAAIAWWVVPLLLQGRYSPPFLDIIERSSVTTSSTGWSNSVRGTEHWLAYATTGDRAWWPGAYETATTPALIALTGLIAAIGLFGLCHRRMPVRGPLLTTAVVGLLCLVAGAAASGGSLIDGPIQTLLDGPLAPLRNVHKVDALVRLPLALGLGHAAVLLAAGVRTRWAERREGASLPHAERWLAAGLAALLLVSAAPMWQGHLRMQGWSEIPPAWGQAADWLDEQPGSRVLVVPGTGFGMQTWGWTIDEPLQALAQKPWVSRSQVPMMPGPSARVLDTIERRLTSGTGGDGLAGYLARAGITHVLVRRDLDPVNADGVSLPRVDATLLGSPGLVSVAGFGERVYGLPMLEIFAVDQEAPRVALTPTAQTRHLNGAPDDLLAAIELGALEPTTPTVLSGDDVGEHRLIGDGNLKVERQFGRVHDALGPVLGRDDAFLTDRRLPDFEAGPDLPQTTAESPSGVRVTATSSAGSRDAIGRITPAYAPGAAFDGRATTSWRSAPFTDPEQQELRLDLDRPASAGAVMVRFANGTGVVRVVRASVDVGDGPVVREVPSTGVISVPVARASTTRVKVRVLRVADGDREHGTVGVAEVVVPGLRAGRTRVLPGRADAATDILFTTQVPRRACVEVQRGASCDSTSAVLNEEQGGLDRTFTTTEQGEWDVEGRVVALPGETVAAMLAPLGAAADVRSDSVFAGDPAAAGLFAFDADPITAWLGELGADRATFTMSVPDAGRTISRIRVSPALQGATLPREAVIRSEFGERRVDLTSLGTFDPLRVGSQLTIEFSRGNRGVGDDAKLGLSEIEIEGLQDLRYAPDRDQPTGAVCGLGPAVVIDGEVRDTRVEGTVAQLLRGEPMRWSLCGKEPLALRPGVHRLQVDPSGQFAPINLGLVAEGSTPAAASDRDVDIVEWEPTSRRVRVDPGPESVLRIAENLNPGWGATLNGKKLEQVTVDGWQQGYVVPAGASGEVEVTFGPDRTYRLGLLGGLIIALLLVTGAALALWRDRGRRLTGDAATGRGPAGRIAAVLTGLALLAAGGPFAGLGWAAAWGWRGRRGTALTGALAVLGSAVVAAWFSGEPTSQPSTWANGLAAFGVGALIASVVLPPRSTPFLRLPRPRLSALTVTALALVAGQAVLRTVLAAGSWFWQDDLGHLHASQQLGLSREFLVRDYSGHLEIGQYFMYWLLDLQSMSFAAAATFMVVGQALASLLLWAILRRLFGYSWWLLVPFAAYLFTPLGLITGAWWAAGMQAFPLQVLMLATILSLIGLHQSRGRALAWGVGSLMAHALALLFWQKALLVLPAAVLVVGLVLWAGLPLRERLAALRRRWVWWALHAVVYVGYLSIYLSMSGSGALSGERQLTVLEFLRTTLLAVVVPGAFGGPWHTRGAENSLMPEPGVAVTVTCLVLLTLVLAASLWRRGRGAIAGWFVLLSYLAMDLLLLFTGRAEYLGLVARDPRYVTDALPILVIGICAAFQGPRRRPRHRRAEAGRTESSGRRPIRRPLALACLVTASAMATVVQLVPIVQRTVALDYVEATRAQVPRAPDATVALQPLPHMVSLVVDVPQLLDTVGQARGFEQPGTSLRTLNVEGDVVEATLLDRVEVQTEGEDCAWSLDEYPTLLTRLDAADVRRAVAVEALVSQRVVLHLRAAGVEQAVALESGPVAAWFVVPQETTSVEAWVTPWPGDAGELVPQCATKLVSGVPWPTGE
ncbi:alpha-(1-_3)-arabinofuranosyltransferase family protein [Nocardioides sp. Bht2]|uniref:alpha-(1->3)-arabinofuranosyltransferase domain-containing protein n=1 Tax=Nocardioides sp. Bht2 TaxID=3392297 RepID=UPI0039B40D45